MRVPARLTTATRIAVAGLIVVSATVGLGTAAPPRAYAVGVHPRLLLTAADLPAIRARAASGEGARAWGTLKERLDDYTTSPADSPWHLDPANVPARNSDGSLKNYAAQNEMPTMLTDLAFGYLVTGDSTYADLAINLMEALGDAHWPYWSDTNQYLGAGDLLRGIALAYDWTYSAMTPTQRSDIVTKLQQPMTVGPLSGRPLLDAAVIDGNAADPGTNWSGVVEGGAGLALLAIQGEPDAPSYLSSYLSTAQSRINSFLATSVGPDGEGGEGYTYLGYGLHGALPFVFALKANTGTDLLATNPGLGHIANYVAASLIPAASYDGSLPLNDSDRDALDDELIEQLWPITADQGLVSAVWERTLGPAGIDRYAPGRSLPDLPGHNCLPATTNPPVYLLGCGWSNAEELNLLYNGHASTPAIGPDTVLPLASHFDAHGIVTARTGWAAGGDDVLAAFSVSRGSGGHKQEDVGQFLLYGYGGDFAVDSGYGHDYSCTAQKDTAGLCDLSDQSTKDGQSVGHNLMLVDDDARTQLGARVRTSTETIPEFVNAPGLAYAYGDTRTQFPSNPPAAGRDWLFTTFPGRPVVLAIGDELQRDGATHGYNFQLHTSAANAVELRANGFSVVAPSGAVMTGLAARNGDQQQSVESPFSAKPFDGNPFDRPAAHTLLLQLSPTKTVSVSQLTVLALTPSGVVPPAISRLEVPGADAVEVVTGGAGQIFLQRLLGGGPSSALGFTLDGAFGTAVQGAGEAFLRDGNRLTAYGADYITVTGGPASVAVGGSSAQATGPSGNTYRVFAPQVLTSVTVNDVAVTSCRSGDYVSFPC